MGYLTDAAIGPVAWVEILKASGPYGIIVALGIWAVARDRQLRELYDKVLELGREQTTAQVELRASVDALKDVVRTAIDAMSRRG